VTIGAPSADLEVSVVVPVFGNAGTLEELLGRVVATLVRTGTPFEVVFVDDGSPDDSLAVLRMLAARDGRVRVHEHGANRGQSTAVVTGLRAARGRWTVVLDADLQDPPEAMAELLRLAGNGVDAVLATRVGRYESAARTLTSRAYKRVLAWWTGLPVRAGGFVAIGPSLRQRLLALGEMPSVVAAIGSLGGEWRSVPVARAVRPQGSSAYRARDRSRVAWRTLRWLARRPRRERSR
jgi:glycosyltransferase involved in cell wall biosynthesis